MLYETKKNISVEFGDAYFLQERMEQISKNEVKNDTIKHQAPQPLEASIMKKMREKDM